jgi:hypothetical protein
MVPAMEMGEQPASNGAARGRWHQQGPSAAPPGAGSYRNQTTGEPFSWAVAGVVMLLVVVRLHALQDLRMELLEAMCVNPGDAGLRAQFEQAQHNVVVTMAELRALEAQWGFGARAPPLAVP